MTTIYVWPDKSWLRKEDYEDVEENWRGDDFEIIEFQNDLSDEEIEKIINE